MEEADDTLERPIAGRDERGIGYRKITETLIADIGARQWRPGDQLPTEAELVERFGASRNTIRESLRELEVFGYIKRRRGTRSILLSSNPTESFVNSVQSIGELLQYSRRTRSRIISTELVIADGGLVERLGVAQGSQWLQIEILRMPLRGTLPIGFSQIYVDGRYADIAARLNSNLTVYKLLEEDLGLSFRRVEQAIQASAASDELATALQIDPGSPVLEVRTDFISGAGEIVEIGFGHFPAERYRMEIVLERGGVAPGREEQRG